MAKSSFKRLFTQIEGVNNKVDPSRIKNVAQRDGSIIVELAEAINCDIDDTGRISRRYGQVRISADAFDDAFCDKGDCFVVKNRASDSAIYQLSADMTTLTGVRSSLAKGARVSFCQVGAKTYYMNGYQSGVIENGVSSAWPGYTHYGAETTREFYPVPTGTHIAHFDGHMLIVVGNVVWITERYEYGKVRKAKNFWQMGTDITMTKPVAGGIWLSDQEKTGFVQAGEGHIARSGFLKKSSFPAHEWSENIELVDLSQSAFEIPGLSAVWSSDEGMCIGTESGQLIVATKEKLVYPTGGSGATVVDGHVVINSVY